MSRLTVVAVMLVVCIGLAWGQYGTLHLPSAVPWQGDDVQILSQVRIFDGDENQTYNVNARGRLGENTEVQLGWFSMSTEGEDPIAGVVRASNLHLLTLTGLWQVQSGDWRLAFRGGGELPIRTPEGINTALVASAPEFRVIPVGSVVLEFGDPDGTTFILEPKGVGFDADMPAVFGGPIIAGSADKLIMPNGFGVVEGFGNLFILGAGVRMNGGRISAFADAAYPLSGENSLDEDTNQVEQALAWGAGLSYLVGGAHDFSVHVGVSNTAGRTPATSTIVAPGDSIGFVGGFDFNW